MPKTAATRAKEYRDKQRAAVEAIIEDYTDDVEVWISPKDGDPTKQVITFDMGADTEAALQALCHAKGTTLDAVLRGVIDAHLKQAAKLGALKRKHGKASTT